MHLHPPNRLVDLMIAKAKENPIPSIFGPDGSLYMERYTLYRKPQVWARIHVTYRSDLDPHLHDHPWRNVSWILKNGYLEQMPDRSVYRYKGDIIYRGLKSRHRLDLLIDDRGAIQPCTSLFITGEWKQVWGFFLENNVKVPWKQYIHQRDHPNKHGFNNIVLLKHIEGSSDFTDFDEKPIT